MGSDDKTLFSSSKATILCWFRFTWMISYSVVLHILVSKFLNIMSSKFEMSMMGELNFFLGLKMGHLCV
jgi:hypothetical protein